MNVTKLDYNLEKFDDENIQLLLTKLGLNKDNYFIAMTKPSILTIALVGTIAEFANRYCIICFSETELNFIMLSRLNSKKVTELIKIQRTEIDNLKLKNILISYIFTLKADKNKMIFQVYKKVAKIKNTNESIKLFKQIYNI